MVDVLIIQKFYKLLNSEVKLNYFSNNFLQNMLII